MKETLSVMAPAWTGVRIQVRNIVENNVKKNAAMNVSANVVNRVWRNVIANVRNIVVEYANDNTKNELITKSQLEAAYKSVRRI